MRNRMYLLLAFLAAFTFASPVLAAPPEDDAKTEEKAADEPAADDAKADDAKADDVKADDAKADDAKTEEKASTDGAAEGPAEIGSDDEAVDTVGQLVAAAKEGHWSLVVAFSIMLLVYLLNRVGLASKLGPKAVPWLAAGTGVLGYVAAHLMVEGATIVDGVTSGVMAGAAAVGLWELLFKHIMGTKSGSSEGGS